MPWIAKDVNSCPLAKLNDGKCDITIISNETNGGRCALTRYLLNSETGSYFDNQGQINANAGMHYLKSKSWELDPHVKAYPHGWDPETHGQPSADYAYDNSALFSIDGERYKSQRFKAVVRPRFLPVYI